MKHHFTSVSFCAFASVLSSLIAAQPDEHSSRVFMSTKYRYSVHYPHDWHFQGMSGHFVIETFLPARKLRRSPTPPGWAAIGVMVPEGRIQNSDQAPKNLSEWVALGTRYQTIVAQRTLAMPDGYPFKSAIEVTGRCCAAPPFLVETSWYFEIEGRFLGVYMEHYQGEDKARSFRLVFEQVAKSLRVVQP